MARFGGVRFGQAMWSVDGVTAGDVAAAAASAPTVARLLALVSLLARPGDRLDHEYDLSDGWRHEIELEAVEPGPNDGVSCVDGAGRCPPEDVGGMSGYDDLRRLLADPDDERHAEMLAWMGLESAEELEVETFSVQAADEAIAGVLVARAR